MRFTSVCHRFRKPAYLWLMRDFKRSFSKAATGVKFPALDSKVEARLLSYRDGRRSGVLRRSKTWNLPDSKFSRRRRSVYLWSTQTPRRSFSCSRSSKRTTFKSKPRKKFSARQQSRESSKRQTCRCCWWSFNCSLLWLTYSLTTPFCKKRY